MRYTNDLPVVRQRTTKKIRCCPNCKALPVFRQSDDPEYKTLLAHESEMCPAQFGLVVYHNNQPEAVDLWNEHVQALLAKRVRL